MLVPKLKSLLRSSPETTDRGEEEEAAEGVATAATAAGGATLFRAGAAESAVGAVTPLPRLRSESVAAAAAYP